MYSKRLMKGALRAFCSVVFLLLFSLSSKAQSNDGWILHSVNAGVEVYYKPSKCVQNTVITNPTSVGTTTNFPNVLLLKFVNTNANSKTVSWNAALNSSSSALTHSAVLTGTNSLEISCTDAPIYELSTASISPQPKSFSEAITFLNLSVSTN